MASNRLRFAEFALWVLAVSAAVSAAAIAVGYLVGGTLVTSKYAVFLVGILLFGIGSLGIQPTPSYKDEKRVSLESTHEHGFEARIQEIPPLRGEHVPFDQRVGRNKKVFAASLLVLGVSLVMEFWLGIRV
ncbi:hypothetical protein ACFQMA_20835 [Halosimplex aquaticum]|uniref:Uncharacterized protein n=1 Tax=Halosimplex aquaticum TaxID=3026162 RepID=A0ABD5Y4A0_9EURY|nr:hypothetical protein [Halosimplex aquaticum]